jgi:large subunit ribosomal protein L18
MGLRTMKRRRREKKTDYKLRMNILKAGKERIVIRRTNKYYTLQLVKSKEGQDETLTSATSKELIKKGWDKKYEGSLKNKAAGYLTGILLAKKIGKGNYPLDLGMARTIPKTRIYAVIKGLIDGGLTINTKEEKVLPTTKEIEGEHLKEELKKVIEKVKKNLE